jgi:hypothetical protein
VPEATRLRAKMSDLAAVTSGSAGDDRGQRASAT